MDSRQQPASGDQRVTQAPARGGLRLSTPAEHAVAQAWLKETVKPPVTIAMNVGVASQIDASSSFVFNRRVYVVPPLSYRNGIVLQELYIELTKSADQQEETPEQLTALLALCDRAARIFPTLCEPANWLVRRVWHLGWLRNPFLTATSAELAQLLGFFLQCRMKSSVQLLESSAHRPALASLTRRTS